MTSRAITRTAGVCGLLLLAACGGNSGGTSTGAQPTGAPTNGGTLKLLGSGDVDHLDPASAYYTVSYTLERAFTRQLCRRARPVLRVDDLSVDQATHQVRRGDQEIRLSPKEYALLLELMRHPGQPLTRAQLIEHVWDFAFDSESNVVDVYIGYLRDKLDRPFGRHTIETVRGVGYRVGPADSTTPTAARHSSGPNR